MKTNNSISYKTQPCFRSVNALKNGFVSRLHLLNPKTLNNKFFFSSTVELQE